MKRIIFASFMLIVLLVGCSNQPVEKAGPTAIPEPQLTVIEEPKESVVPANATAESQENLQELAVFPNETAVVSQKPVEEKITAYSPDPFYDKYKSCIGMILISEGEAYDETEFKLSPGAEVSQLQCLMVGQELLMDEEKYSGPSYQGKLIDAHNHFFYGSSASDLISKMDKAKIDEILILSGDSLQLYNQYPTRIIPFWGDYSMSVEKIAEQAEQKLEEGYKGIGEISLRHAAVPGADVETKNPADSAAMKKIADIAAKHDVLVNVHHEFEYEELERLLDYNKNAKIVLAHAGLMNYEVPFRIDRLMSTHQNLYVDLSQQIPLFKPKIETDESYYLLLANGKINPMWKYLLEKFPDRFFVGGDYYVEDRNSLDRESTELRKMLGQLKTSAAEKIAYKNILDLTAG